jgi:hypothetical protein
MATVACLSNEKVAPYPTMGEDRIYDSRHDPDLQFRSAQPRPMAVVYTESEVRTPINPNDLGTVPFKAQLELIIQLSLTGDDDYVQTGKELEAQLDLFEDQVVRTLFDPSRPASLAWLRTFKRVIQIDSVRVSATNVSHRIAMREIAVLLEYDDKCWPLSRAFPDFEAMHMQAAAAGTDQFTTVEIIN